MHYNSHLKNLVSALPHEPGIYQYFDKDGTIIYIGKAKDLKKRVSSYFTKTHDNRKTAILVRNIIDIKTMPIWVVIVNVALGIVAAFAAFRIGKIQKQVK